MENENLNETKEKMIKKCKKISDVMEILLWLIIFMLIIGVVVGIIDAIVMWNDGASGLEIINEITYSIRYILDIDTEFSLVETIIGIILGVLSFIVLKALSKIFKNTADEGTPFSTDNLKNMKKISICADIAFFITLFSQVFAIGVAYVLAIGGIEYIFRYGYKLQLESDETL